MRKRSNRMFSLRSDVELGDWLPLQTGAVPGELGWVREPGPSRRMGQRVATTASSRCAHLPGCQPSGFGYEHWYHQVGLWYDAGCVASHRALLGAYACISY